VETQELQLETEIQELQFEVETRDLFESSVGNKDKVSGSQHFSNGKDHTKSFICDFDSCSAVFPSLRKFGAHTQNIHKVPPLRCPEHTTGCPFRAMTKQKLDHHVIGVHVLKYGQQHPCDICQKVFRSRTHLKEHTKRLHSTVEEKVCPFCGVKKRHLGDHLIRAHKDAIFNCKYCPKKFKTRSQLRWHHNFHVGFKPYTCADCTLTFPRAHHRKAHLAQANHRPGVVLKEVNFVDHRRSKQTSEFT